MIRYNKIELLIILLINNNKMRKSFEYYFEKFNDKYIENFFYVLNIFITKTILLREITPSKGDAMEVNIIFLLRTLTTHYQFTEKYKKKLEIEVCPRTPEDIAQDIFPGDTNNFFVKFFYKKKEVLVLLPHYSFSNDIDKWEILLYMDNLHFGRPYLEKCLEIPFHIANIRTPHDEKICRYISFGSRNLKISDLLEHFHLPLEEIKNYFYFYLIVERLEYNYTDEEIEEYKNHLNWVHLLMYYKKINNTFLKKYRKEIVKYMIKDLKFSEDNQNKAICYFLAQNSYICRKIVLKIVQTQKFRDKDFTKQFFDSKMSIMDNGYRFLKFFEDNHYLIIVNNEADISFWDFYRRKIIGVSMQLEINVNLPNKMLSEILLRYTNFSKKVVNNCFTPSNKWYIFRNRHFRIDLEDPNSIYDFGVFTGHQRYSEVYEYRPIQHRYFTERVITNQRIDEWHRPITENIPECRFTKRHFVVDDYSVNDIVDDKEALECVGIDTYRDKFVCNFSSGRDVFLEKFFLNHRSAKKIQRWWKKLYFDPNHPVGKKVMERIWEESKDLFIEI